MLLGHHVFKKWQKYFLVSYTVLESWLQKKKTEVQDTEVQDTEVQDSWYCISVWEDFVCFFG